MTDHSKMKLGKKPARHDPRTLQMANYLKAEALPKLPAALAWTSKVSQWPVMGNDKTQDCTCAAAGHLIEEWTAYSSAAVIVPDAEILAVYSAVTGYNPKTGKPDGGAAALDVLNYWRHNGVGGHKIQSFVALEPTNHDHVRASVLIFGGCYIGLGLPLSAQKQKVWSVAPGGAKGAGKIGSWGGHAVPVVGYDAHGLTVVSWGALKQMTWGFWKMYCDEAYAVLSAQWVNAKDVAANGFDLAELNQDLSRIAK
jgi:hypothetical protein